MEPTADLSPLSSLGTIIGWLVIGLAVVLTMLAVLRLLDGTVSALWRDTHKSRNQRR